MSPYNKGQDRAFRNRIEEHGFDPNNVSEVRWFHVAYSGSALRRFEAAVQRGDKPPAPAPGTEPMTQGFYPKSLVVDEMNRSTSHAEASAAPPLPNLEALLADAKEAASWYKETVGPAPRPAPSVGAPAAGLV